MSGKCPKQPLPAVGKVNQDGLSALQSLKVSAGKLRLLGGNGDQEAILQSLATTGPVSFASNPRVHGIHRRTINCRNNPHRDNKPQTNSITARPNLLPPQCLPDIANDPTPAPTGDHRDLTERHDRREQDPPSIRRVDP